MRRHAYALRTLGLYNAGMDYNGTENLPDEPVFSHMCKKMLLAPPNLPKEVHQDSLWQEIPHVLWRNKVTFMNASGGNSPLNIIATPSISCFFAGFFAAGGSLAAAPFP